jgi:hypothetical protein
VVTLIAITYSDGKRQRCDARCHNATSRHCTCPCGGRYHGKGEGTLAFTRLVEENQGELLTLWGKLEMYGAGRVTYARASLQEVPFRRSRKAALTDQLELLPGRE